MNSTTTQLYAAQPDRFERHRLGTQAQADERRIAAAFRITGIGMLSILILTSCLNMDSARTAPRDVGAAVEEAQFGWPV